jgi:hypothetical protein
MPIFRVIVLETKSICYGLSNVTPLAFILCLAAECKWVTEKGAKPKQKKKNRCKQPVGGIANPKWDDHFTQTCKGNELVAPFGCIIPFDHDDMSAITGRIHEGAVRMATLLIMTWHPDSQVSDKMKTAIGVSKAEVSIESRFAPCRIWALSEAWATREHIAKEVSIVAQRVPTISSWYYEGVDSGSALPRWW